MVNNDINESVSLSYGLHIHLELVGACAKFRWSVHSIEDFNR